MFLIDMFNKKTVMPTAENALPGRTEPLPTAETHFISGLPLKGPYPEQMQTIYLGLGCFWGAERLLWQTPGVYVTAAGYQGGITPNPTYQETVTGLTGHTEVVKVVYDPAKISLEALLKIFFEAHDPTQGMRQGNDIGTTYRSAIYVETEEDMALAIRVRDAFQNALVQAGHNSRVTTEIAHAGPFYYAEEYHQQYLAKNPNGYCGLQGTGVSCPISPAA
ncbi:peptide-methionine (S)-S-oxide reductase MsrA [Rhizobium glycinendophyticum]|uniref:Peptide methionine sulfoxide reductase MsrA n=1 Tax=Rhizobium glycinendophyticum TaxID=2589807 RepID=A0A504U4G1_9HYPH|nr:peptide-methionine (S)-S-oxide reductase MsrA [Rhizobium glycinendophyticum]TPP09369.1 peptide-methionine (S)-S-oxide reductase MsrA [Rhizobium glycinendophyticum]